MQWLVLGAGSGVLLRVMLVGVVDVLSSVVFVIVVLVCVVMRLNHKLTHHKQMD